MNLDAIIAALMKVETKGESTLILADCVRLLASMKMEAEAKQEADKADDRGDENVNTEDRR